MIFLSLFKTKTRSLVKQMMRLFLVGTLEENPPSCEAPPQPTIYLNDHDAQNNTSLFSHKVNRALLSFLNTSCDAFLTLDTNQLWQSIQSYKNWPLLKLQQLFRCFGRRVERAQYQRQPFDVQKNIFGNGVWNCCFYNILAAPINIRHYFLGNKYHK